MSNLNNSNIDIDSLQYNIENLGYQYAFSRTTFKAFAPLYEELFLVIDNKDRYQMSKDNDIFSYTLEDNLEGHLFHYEYKDISFVDPFSFCQSHDKKDSIIIDMNKLNNEIYKVKEDKEIVIYEVSIRDFTSSLRIKSKKTFKGFIQENIKKDNHEVGFDYLKNLGISHIQIMPIFDFDDDNTDYNWGYNPISYSCLKYEYINNPEDYYNQINEFRSLVNKCHENNIKVVLDVVFNHVYDAKTNNLNKMIPDYFFRIKEDGSLANGSWCGNEVASEKGFVRAYIKEIIKRYIKLFDIDGLRFDLMGLIDIQTMNEISEMTRNIKADFLLYGEGWNMGEVIPEEDRATDLNINKLNNIGSFNQFYRDGIINSILKDENNYEYIKDLIDASKNYNFTPSQSINYVECHDGLTFFDRTYGYSIEERIKRSKLALAIIALSRGIPFYQSGQEFLRSKRGIENTYNLSDKINTLKWKDSIKNIDLVNYFKALVKLRNTIGISKLKEEDIYIESYYEVIKYHLGDYLIFINLCDYDHIYEDEKEYEIIFDINGFNTGTNRIININSNSLIVVKK